MQGQEPETAGKHLRVKVVDHTKEDGHAVNIRVPIGVVKFRARNNPAVRPRPGEIRIIKGRPRSAAGL